MVSSKHPGKRQHYDRSILSNRYIISSDRTVTANIFKCTITFRFTHYPVDDYNLKQYLIMEPLRIPMKCALRFMLTLVITVALVYYLILCLLAFVSNPTYTDITMVDQQKAAFPVVTVCPKPGYKGKVLEVSQAYSAFMFPSEATNQKIAKSKPPFQLEEIFVEIFQQMFSKNIIVTPIMCNVHAGSWLQAGKRVPAERDK